MLRHRTALALRSGLDLLDATALADGALGRNLRRHCCALAYTQLVMTRTD